MRLGFLTSALSFWRPVALDTLNSPLRMMTNVVNPQYAGSGWVCNCSINGKRAYVPPVENADANMSRPSVDENDMDEDGNRRR